MTQYLIIAQDGTDENALDRRMAIRPSHLDKVRELKSNDNFIIGGAILNESEQMAGSVMIVQFENDEALNQWLATEPYINGKVWEKYEVKNIRLANI